MSEVDYKPLRSGYLQAGAICHQPSLFSPQPVRIDSPAIEVMTDLRLVAVATIDAEISLAAASQAMIARGVRSLLVTERGAIVGLITARDLLGERPLQVMRESGTTHDELCVRHIMTPHGSVEVLDISDVLRARVGNIVATLRHAARQHALVVETDVLTGRQVVRGVFSISQIARQLGIPLHTTEVPRAFAAIEAAVSPVFGG